MLDFLEILLNNAYLSLFAYSLFASTLIPFGSEGLLAYFVSQKLNIPVIILVATAGNYLGSVVNYYIGIRGSKTIFYKIIKFDHKKVEKASERLEKYGHFILFFSWLPIIGDPLTFVAGLLKYDFKKFTFYVILGKMFRYVVVVFITLGVLF